MDKIYKRIIGHNLFLEDPGVDGKLIIIWIVRKWNGGEWNG